VLFRCFYLSLCKKQNIELDLPNLEVSLISRAEVKKTNKKKTPDLT